MICRALTVRSINTLSRVPEKMYKILHHCVAVEFTNISLENFGPAEMFSLSHSDAEDCLSLESIGVRVGA